MAKEARPGPLLTSRERAPMTGLYLAEEHFHEGFRMELLLSAGDEVPVCPHCGKKVVWTYLGRTGSKVIDKERLARR